MFANSKTKSIKDFSLTSKIVWHWTDIGEQTKYDCRNCSSRLLSELSSISFSGWYIFGIYFQSAGTKRDLTGTISRHMIRLFLGVFASSECFCSLAMTVVSKTTTNPTSVLTDIFQRIWGSYFIRYTLVNTPCVINHNGLWGGVHA